MDVANNVSWAILGQSPHLTIKIKIFFFFYFNYQNIKNVNSTKNLCTFFKQLLEEKS